jgi:tRNA U34 5-methylaminomethyl-2-thiouridine-forming methyltransferase MnmC
MNARASENASIIWHERSVPVSTRFDDRYFAEGGGLAETEHVFLAGNDLPARFRPGFHIAELGFGTGLNALAAARAWSEAGCRGRLRFTSFEAFPMQPDDMERALSTFPDIAPLARQLVAAIRSGASDMELPGLELTIVEGDARLTLPDWIGRADAWFLDGFSPSRNPELWEPGLLRAVAAHTAPNGSFATYSAAGAVRAGLADAGFAVERRPGFGHKRHMSCGRLDRR